MMVARLGGRPPKFLAGWTGPAADVASYAFRGRPAPRPRSPLPTCPGGGFSISAHAAGQGARGISVALPAPARGGHKAARPAPRGQRAPAGGGPCPRGNRPTTRHGSPGPPFCGLWCPALQRPSCHGAGAGVVPGGPSDNLAAPGTRQWCPILARPSKAPPGTTLRHPHETRANLFSYTPFRAHRKTGLWSGSLHALAGA